MAEGENFEESSKKLQLFTKESSGRVVFPSTESKLQQVRDHVWDAAEWVLSVDCAAIGILPLFFRRVNGPGGESAGRSQSLEGKLFAITTLAMTMYLEKRARTETLYLLNVVCKVVKMVHFFSIKPVKFCPTPLVASQWSDPHADVWVWVYTKF